MCVDLLVGAPAQASSPVAKALGSAGLGPVGCPALPCSDVGSSSGTSGFRTSMLSLLLDLRVGQISMARFVQTKKSAQETINCLHKFVPPDQEPSIMHTDSCSLEFSRACEDLCHNHDKSTPYRSETNGIAENAHRRVKIMYLCSYGSVGSFRKVVERSDGVSLLFAKHKTNWQTESHRVKEDPGTPYCSNCTLWS